MSIVAQSILDDALPIGTDTAILSLQKGNNMQEEITPEEIIAQYQSEQPATQDEEVEA